MKKLIFFLLLLTVISAKAQIHISYKDYPPIIDGDISDWKIISYTFLQTSPPVKSHNKLRYDFGFDENHLYGVFQVKDQQLIDLAKDKNG
ncbi:MAG: hypothetical protein K9I84_12585, partial [Leadbetterella sp.]|nr:hypothetical protein [Leadbetterella sp.]